MLWPTNDWLDKFQFPALASEVVGKASNRILLRRCIAGAVAPKIHRHRSAVRTALMNVRFEGE
jgi:hypothetical protein